MYRLFKFYNSYKNDSKFDDLSTVEALPVLLPDTATLADFETACKQQGLTISNVQTFEQHEYKRMLTLAFAAETTETHTFKRYNGPETVQVYVALAYLDVGDYTALNPILEPRDMTDAEAEELFCGGETHDFEISDWGMIDGEEYIVICNHKAYQILPLFGYSFESMLKARGIGEDNVAFDDSVSRCSACGELDWNDNGYQNNFRVPNYELLGINCGCYDSYCESNVEDFANKADQAIELSLAQNLEKAGRLVHMQRAIGGWVDGRGGYFDGESCDDGDPKTMLAAALKQFPNDQFVFSHDESGQFQVYFSLWRIVPEATVKPVKRRSKPAKVSASKRPKKVTKAKAKRKAKVVKKVARKVSAAKKRPKKVARKVAKVAKRKRA